MNSLVSKCLEEGNIFPLTVIPEHLINEIEKKLIEWIVAYKAEYKVAPTVSRLKTKFPGFVSIERKEPLSDINDQFLKNRIQSYWLFQVGKIEHALEMGESVDFATATREILNGVSNPGASFEIYREFDRGKYFRSGLTKLGINLLDEVMGGVANGDFMLIVGRLGTAKSTITTWIAYKWFLQSKRILFISKEMLPADIFGRLDGMIAKFNPLDIRREVEDIRSKVERAKGLAKAVAGEIYIPNGVVEEIDQIGELARNLEVDAVIIDGLHLMASKSGNRARWERTAETSNLTKQMAISIQKPVIAISQLKRVGEKREYDTEDIGYSDALGQDADFVAATYPLDLETGRFELQLIKNRFGGQIATIINIDFTTMTIVEEITLGAKVEEGEWHVLRS